MPEALRALWRLRGPVLGAAALVLGSAGEALPFRERWRPVGALALVAAALLAGLAWYDIRDRQSTAIASDEPTRPSFLVMALLAAAH